jgi:hypothetical protein
MQRVVLAEILYLAVSLHQVTQVTIMAVAVREEMLLTVLVGQAVAVS